MNWRRLILDQRAASAAEFALILPLFLLIFFGIIDAGRFAWEFNQAEKATQTGARWAAATDMLPSELVGYSFAISCSVPQGTPVTTQFTGAQCSSGSAANTATCAVTTTCSGLGNTTNQAAFTKLYDRMADIYPAIGRDDVQIDYTNSGLGYAGDPNGPDVAPLITVSLRDSLRFQPLTLMLFGGTLPMPSASYSITMEDGQGDKSN